ncbi:MAG: hypothetical protein CVV44_04070 [Spirochaetae bacterium HGW-Spirochaetae-1]|jgi:hypothetical protein|nr:MAG: hypothetical protein CVV44_04070 [Spirochaetae bacterium HGW-Spirochaetae-1]
MNVLSFILGGILIPLVVAMVLCAIEGAKSYLAKYANWKDSSEEWERDQAVLSAAYEYLEKHDMVDDFHEYFDGINGETEEEYEEEEETGEVETAGTVADLDEKEMAETVIDLDDEGDSSGAAIAAPVAARGSRRKAG